jgi:hypothetical protein
MSAQTQSTVGGEKSLPNLQRRDAWWIAPGTFFVVFSLFGMWTTFRAFQNNYYYVAPYLSPFYSPTIPLHWQIAGYHVSPALYILVFPLCFRMSCYYYRKSIYRSYLADPVACAVTEPAPLQKARYRRYTGERVFPFFAMNFHRFAFYAAVIFVLFLWKDTFEAFACFPNSDGNGTHFGIGIGSLIMLANILLLSAYTFSCHSWRHLIGGGVDCYSCTALNRTRYGLWQKISFINEKHGTWAMMSLCSVAITDIYVFLVATGTVHDLHLLG